MSAWDAVCTVLTPSQTKCVTSDIMSRNPILKHHHIAVVYSCKTGNVLANGTNRVTSKGSVHAEVDALTHLHARLRDRVCAPCEFSKGVNIISLRVSPGGELRLAKPCVACANALKRCTLIKRVEWSDQCGQVISERLQQFLPTHHCASSLYNVNRFYESIPSK